jgi:hypothetical protein
MKYFINFSHYYNNYHAILLVFRLSFLRMQESQSIFIIRQEMSAYAGMTMFFMVIFFTWVNSNIIFTCELNYFSNVDRTNIFMIQ